MQKRESRIIPPITGIIDRMEMTDRGVRYIGKDSGDGDVSIDITDYGIAVNAGGKMVLLSGDFKVRDDNDRKYLIQNTKEGTFLDLFIEDEGRFTLKYGREQGYRTGED